MNRCRRTLVLALASLYATAWAGVSTVEQARIDRLIAFVETRKSVTFIRNGNDYSCEDAAKFMRSKMKMMGGDVFHRPAVDQPDCVEVQHSRAALLVFADGKTQPGPSSWVTN